MRSSPGWRPRSQPSAPGSRFAKRFQHHQVKQDLGGLALAMVITRPELGLDRMPNAHVMTEDPLELLTCLRSVTAARYAGDETVREARCRKFAATVGGTTAVFTVWVDNEHVRQIQVVTSKTAERIAVAVRATTTVTAQLWDFGVPIEREFAKALRAKYLPVSVQTSR